MICAPAALGKNIRSAMGLTLEVKLDCGFILPGGFSSRINSIERAQQAEPLRLTSQTRKPKATPGR